MTNSADLQEELGAALVRIRPVDGGDAVGVGTLIEDRGVLTCAHVVNAALGLAEDATERPKGVVVVDFPFSSDKRQFSARVDRWVPIDDAGGGDVAVLLITKEPPVDTLPVDLLDADRLRGHEFTVLGFPDRFPNGVLATGVLVGRNAAGWVQMEGTRAPGPRVREGFSGGPVYDGELRAVVGIVALASRNEVEKLAFLIPTAAVNEGIGPRRSGDAASPPRLRVFPVALEFGTVGPHESVVASIDVQTRRGDFTTELQPAGGFVVTDFSDGPLVEAAEDFDGERSACLTVRAGRDRKEIQLSATVTFTADGVLEEWPALDEQAVRASLQACARNHFTLKDTEFDGPLEVDYRPVARVTVTRVYEARSSGTRSSPYPLFVGNTFAGSIHDVQAPLAPWLEQTWLGVLQGSVRQLACRDCDSDHRVFCPKCRGRTKIPCPKDEECPTCEGDGVAEQDGVPALCVACHASGRLLCAICAGTAVRACDECGDGKVPCPNCDGSGKYVTYVCGEIQRTVEREELDSPWPEGDLPLEAEDFVPLRFAGSDGLGLVPPELRDGLTEWLAAQGTRPKEILRKVQASVAPASVVSYQHGRHDARALSVGTRVVPPSYGTLMIWSLGDSAASWLHVKNAEE